MQPGRFIKKTVVSVFIILRFELKESFIYTCIYSTQTYKNLDVSLLIKT